MAGKIDKYSETWATVQAHVKARIEALRDELEHATDPEEGQIIRGAIAELRDLAKLADPPPPVPTVAEDSHGVEV